MDIWVQVFNLPLSIFTEVNVVHIESFIGTFLSVDLGGMNRRAFSKYLRIRVRIPIDRSLVMGFFLEREGK